MAARIMAHSRRMARLCGLLSLCWMATGSAQAQVAPGEFFTEPILIHTGGGHHAPVRSMLFTADGGQLLTGGMDKVVHVWGLASGRTPPVRTLRPPNWRG